MKKTPLHFILILLVSFFSLFAYAESEGILNKLLAPGPLVKGHQDLENKDCLKCHDAGKGVPNSKCLECHKAIRPFVAEKRGFHGLTSKNCMECHREHQGRNYDSVAVDQNKFEHGKLTGYTLEGKHAEIKCKECHKEKMGPKSVRAGDIKYLGSQASTCKSCHKEDDIHFFKNEFAKKDCNSCHTLKSWKDSIKFDHNRDTNYKLVAKHAELKCNDCHLADKRTKNFRYQWPQLKTAQCLSCHENIHKANLSRKFSDGKCTNCHSQESWKIQNFDHKITGYKLAGKHADLKCTECHKQTEALLKSDTKKNYKWAGLKSQCLTCHDDFHRFGPIKNPHLGGLNNCSACHTEKAWKPSINFNHDKHTRYKIDGAHLELDCKDCHITKDKRSIYKYPKLAEKTCETCHKNVHIGVFSKDLLKKQCTVCHTTDSWTTLKNGKGFDHSKTRFPLTGSHLTAKCAECHGPSGKQVFKFKSPQAKFCIDCHNNIHTNQFSKTFAAQNCTECHNTKTFKERLPFDHAKTNYKLAGAHSKLKCQECHKPTTAPPLVIQWPNIDKKESPRNLHLGKYLFPELNRQQCLSCHQDYHVGQLDTRCTQCHTENTWKPAQFNHDTQSSFPLKHKHADVKCSECHKNTNKVITFNGNTRAVVRFKPLASQCVDCHKDPHKGSLGQRCQECHIEKNWKVTRDFHKNFTLTGVHYTLECAECHKDGKKLAGLSQQCYFCHQKDDVHSGTLPNCKECHTQQLWELNRFKHSLTRFPLRGAHRTLDCMECHRTGVYNGLNSQCVSCHLADYNAHPIPEHNGNLDCAQCHHNQFNFGNVR